MAKKPFLMGLSVFIWCVFVGLCFARGKKLNGFVVALEARFCGICARDTGDQGGFQRSMVGADSLLHREVHGRFTAKRVFSVMPQQMKLQRPETAAMQDRLGSRGASHATTGGNFSPVEFGHIPNRQHGFDGFDDLLSGKGRPRFDFADVVSWRIAVFVKIH